MPSRNSRNSINLPTSATTIAPPSCASEAIRRRVKLAKKHIVDVPDLGPDLPREGLRGQVHLDSRARLFSEGHMACRLSRNMTRASGSGFRRDSGRARRRSRASEQASLMRRRAISELFTRSSSRASLLRSRGGLACSMTVAVAVRGFSFRIAISPMNSPRPSVASGRSLCGDTLAYPHEAALEDEHLFAALPFAKEHLAGMRVAAEARKEGIAH